jgi:hypothetical protein
MNPLIPHNYSDSMVVATIGERISWRAVPLSV